MYLSVAGVLIKDAAVGGRIQTIKIVNSKLYWLGQTYTTLFIQLQVFFYKTFIQFLVVKFNSYISMFCD